ncbi:hypothetical protein ACVGVM_17965 [Pseudonocardia bannensis]|uniref:ACT domain-containing protein n=1 Tax=Pseudonocardia bannensis TaxID=630973 RepID=A0A848DPC2_9PSEU|nr:hypothetical protein [Pseudonocardia bannensis]NMH94690.1 hypothetical protein [Pseudonocardia bannensis]
MSLTADATHGTFSDIASRIHRRHTVVTSGGMDGVLRVAALLQSSGYHVRDFSADVREGVIYSSLSCTISMTASEAQAFADRVLSISSVVSVDPC